MPRRGSVTVRFGEPLNLGQCDTRAEREAAFDGAEQALRTAWKDLIDDEAQLSTEQA